MKKHDYYKENHFCFNYNYSDYSIHNCKYLFNSNQASAKDNKIKSQSFKAWLKKHIKIYVYMLIILAIIIKAITTFILLLMKITNSTLINHTSIQKTNQTFSQKFRIKVYFST